MLKFGGATGAHRVEFAVPFLALLLSANLAFIQEPYWWYGDGEFRHNQIVALEIVDGQVGRSLALTIGPLLLTITWPLPDL